MTDKQKAAFLRKEGWKLHGYFSWTDPVSGLWIILPGAYRIASRRKSARDRRRLVKAGFEFLNGKWWGPSSFRLGDEEWVGHTDFDSKSEALKFLAPSYPSNGKDSPNARG